MESMRPERLEQVRCARSSSADYCTGCGTSPIFARDTAIILTIQMVLILPIL
jgi:hypothetical protein